MPQFEIPIDADCASVVSSLSSSVSSLNLNNQHRQLSRSSNSSLDYNPNNDEEYYPGQAYLLPVVVPPPQVETTLEELLRNVTGRDDIQNVESLKLRVISLTVSLYRLSLFIPNLSSLNLDGSVLSSLRDLGSGLTHLTFLNISNCGLTSLDGTNGISSVRILIADCNLIQLVGPIQNLPLLKKLSLKNNRICDLAMLIYLGICELLEEVEFQGNPIVNEQLYVQNMKQNLPLLKYLDGKRIDNDEDHSKIKNSRIIFGRSSSSSDASENLESGTSTLSDELFSTSDPYEIFDEQNTLNRIDSTKRQRPTTSQGIRHVTFKEKVDKIERPVTTTSVQFTTKQSQHCSLTSGDAVCGSIIRTLRKQRKSNKLAWDDDYSSRSSSSISSISSDSFSINCIKVTHQKLNDSIKSSDQKDVSSSADETFHNIQQK